MKIAVTGATGFIGQHVVRYLVKYTSNEVIAIYRECDKVKEYDWYHNVEHVITDIYREEKNWWDFIGKPDKLIHLAWAGLPNYNEWFHLTKNLHFDFLFILNLVENGLKDITITGTCLEYGKREGELTEDMEPMPENSYAIAKDNLRRMVQLVSQRNKISFKWLRLFYMYGLGQNPNSLLPLLEDAIEKKERVFNMSGGQQLRDYLPVEKVAEYIVKASLQKSINGIINCSSSQPVKIIDIVNDFIVQKNSKIKLNLGYYPYPDYEPFAFWGNNQKLLQIIHGI